jgi:hypothetical protein
MTILEELERTYGHKWEFHTSLYWGIAATRKQRKLTDQDVIAGMVYVLIGSNAGELAAKLAAQPDSSDGLAPLDSAVTRKWTRWR